MARGILTNFISGMARDEALQCVAGPGMGLSQRLSSRQDPPVLFSAPCVRMHLSSPQLRRLPVSGVRPYLEFARLAPVIPCAARNPYEREPREISLNGLYLLSLLLLLLLLLLLHFPSAQIPPFLRFSPLLRNLISRRKLISCELCEFSCEFRPSDAGDICLPFVESFFCVCAT